jgi:hypothetical protein
MKEKLLALLVAKFKGVSEATLERIATKKAGSVSDESQLQSVADSIDFGQILQSEVDSKITDANKKAIQNYEATHKLKDGKPVDQNPADPDPNKGKDDPLKAFAALLDEKMKPLQDELASFKSGKTLDSRKKTLTERLSDKKYKNIPEKIKAKIHKDFERMSFQKDEDFDAFLQDTETDLAAINQEVAELGLSQHGSPVFNRKEKDGVSSSVQAYVDANKEGAKGNIEGKQI